MNNDSKTNETKWEQDLKTLAVDLEKQAKDLKVFSFLYFSLIADKVNKYLDMHLSENTNISRTGFHVLFQLIRHNGTLSPTKLSREVMRTKYAITSIVDSLIREGLVTTTSSDCDRRAKIIRITQKGLDFVQQNMPGRLEMCHEAMTCLTRQEQKDFLGLLSKLNSHLSGLLNEKNSPAGI